MYSEFQFFVEMSFFTQASKCLVTVPCRSGSLTGEKCDMIIS